MVTRWASVYARMRSVRGRSLLRGPGSHATSHCHSATGVGKACSAQEARRRSWAGRPVVAWVPSSTRKWLRWTGSGKRRTGRGIPDLSKVGHGPIWKGDPETADHDLGDAIPHRGPPRRIPRRRSACGFERCTGGRRHEGKRQRAEPPSPPDDGAATASAARVTRKTRHLRWRSAATSLGRLWALVARVYVLGRTTARFRLRGDLAVIPGHVVVSRGRGPRLSHNRMHGLVQRSSSRCPGSWRSIDARGAPDSDQLHSIRTAPAEIRSVVVRRCGYAEVGALPAKGVNNVFVNHI